MTTIEILRQIVTTHSAETLLFAPPSTPQAEGIGVIADALETSLECQTLSDIEAMDEYGKDRLLVDMQTANVVVLVYDALTPATQAKVERLLLSKRGFAKVVNIAWGAVRTY